jgi:putative alpha-1,2-mannosidase
MIQAGPDTRISGWDSASGYHHGDPSIIGFTHTHLSGTGAIDRLDLLLMPTLGEAKFKRGNESNSLAGYRSAYKNEVASPGYYGVQLTDDNIKVDIAASTRSAIHSYMFKKEDKRDRRLLIDLQHRDDANVVENEIKIISDTEIVGVRRTNNWARNQVIYFYIEFNQSILSADYEYKKSKELKASLNFGNSINNLKAKVAISAVDEQGAKAGGIEWLGIFTGDGT